MISVTEYAFSWYTIGAIVVYFALAVAVYRYIRESSSRAPRAVRGHRIWFSAPDQQRFFGFLFGFHYFEEHDTTLSILALLMQVACVVALYLILATSDLLLVAQLNHLTRTAHRPYA